MIRTGNPCSTSRRSERSSGFMPAPGSSRGGLRRAALDGGGDQVAPLGPAPVVVPDVLHAEEVLEDEPAVARPLPDAAIGDHRLLSGDPVVGVELPQLLGALEGPILVAGLG